MGMLHRLGNVIKSYLNDEDDRVFSKSGSEKRRSGHDPDLDAAFEELEDFLSHDKPGPEFREKREQKTGAREQTPPVPEELRRDFAELEVPFGASREACKESYKKLLKIHHPDRHAAHEGNMKKATEKTARINAAYDRIEKWRETGKL
ncbi:MAG: DnaJ domain-containing protein [Treponema sp.]|jgi:DnaJ-domain-containing protein 1|nr:DnaJ domain-containing protein [Treponema sp.]